MLGVCLFCPVAKGGVTTEVTRIIVQAPAHESGVQLANLNAYPVIVQAWVDDGELLSGPDNSTAPIIALPAVFRLQPGGQRNLRLVYSGAPLPQDRESLFWLNLYEMPPQPQNTATDYLTITLRTQTKVFYRPRGLALKPYQAHERLVFSRKQQANGDCLQVVNGSPYHLTFSDLQLKAGEHAHGVATDMIAPFSQVCLPMNAPLAARGAPVEVNYTLLDDRGNPQSYKAPLED